MDNTAPGSFAPRSTDRSWTFTVRGSQRVETRVMVAPAKHYDPHLFAMYAAFAVFGSTIAYSLGSVELSAVGVLVASSLVAGWMAGGDASYTPAVYRDVARYYRHVTQLVLTDDDLRVDGVVVRWSRIAKCQLWEGNLQLRLANAEVVTVWASAHTPDDLAWLAGLIASFVAEHRTESADRRRVERQARGLKRRVG